jgi:NADH-quinone oxidoreductase subunit A
MTRAVRFKTRSADRLHRAALVVQPGKAAFFTPGQFAMLEQYFPILLFIIVGLGLGLLLLSLGTLLAPNRPDAQKLSPYECGFEAFEDARMKFDVRYYLVAILFILFDLEIAFLVPWAVVLPEIGFEGFVAMMVFLLILVVGFAYEWKKGALEWE